MTNVFSRDRISREFNEFCWKTRSVPTLCDDLLGGITESSIDFCRRLHFHNNPSEELLVNAKGEFFNVEFHYAAGSTWPNAAAQKIGNTNCCLVYESTAFHMLELSFLLFSNPNMLRFIGEPNLETRKPLATSDYPSLTFLRRNSTDRLRWIIEEFAPVCPIRRAFSENFATRLLLYIWLHELEHATGGHTGFVLESCGSLPLYELEVEKSPSPPISKIRRQTIELAADEGAMNGLLANTFINRFVETDVAGVRLKREEWCTFQMLAVLVVCLSWLVIEYYRDRKSNITELRAGAYPTAYVRLISKLVALIQYSSIPQKDYVARWSECENAIEELYLFAGLLLPGEISNSLFAKEKYAGVVHYLCDLPEKADLVNILEGHRYVTQNSVHLLGGNHAGK